MILNLKQSAKLDSILEMYKGLCVQAAKRKTVLPPTLQYDLLFKLHFSRIMNQYYDTPINNLNKDDNNRKKSLNYFINKINDIKLLNFDYNYENDKNENNGKYNYNLSNLLCYGFVRINISTTTSNIYKMNISINGITSIILKYFGCQTFIFNTNYCRVFMRKKTSISKNDNIKARRIKNVNFNTLIDYSNLSLYVYKFLTFNKNKFFNYSNKIEYTNYGTTMIVSAFISDMINDFKENCSRHYTTSKHKMVVERVSMSGNNYNTNNDENNESINIDIDSILKEKDVSNAYNFECGIIGIPINNNNNTQNKNEILFDLQNKFLKIEKYKYDSCWLYNLNLNKNNNDLGLISFYIDCGQYRHRRQLHSSVYTVQTVTNCSDENNNNNNNCKTVIKHLDWLQGTKIRSVDVCIDHTISNQKYQLYFGLNSYYRTKKIHLDFVNYDYVFAVSSIHNTAFKIFFSAQRNL